MLSAGCSWPFAMHRLDDHMAKLEQKLSKRLTAPPPKLAKWLQDEKEAKALSRYASDNDSICALMKKLCALRKQEMILVSVVCVSWQ